MAIIQISKIQVRSGDLVDLPQLDEGEFGWASDNKRLYIGKTTPNENVEILTSYSTIDFSQLNGSYGNLDLTDPVTGQLLTYVASSNTWVNAGGNGLQPNNQAEWSNALIHLGNVSTLKIGGGAIGYVLQTDGVGNLSWTPKGTLYSNIIGLSNATPIVMTVDPSTPYTTDAQITISGVEGANANTIVNGKNFFIQLAVDFPTTGNISLYETAGTSNPVDGTGLEYDNSPNAIATSIIAGGGGGGAAGGSEYSVQYSSGGVSTGDSNIQWDYNNRVLSISGSETVTGNVSAGNISVSGQITSTVATGTAPLVITSTTQVANLNVATSGTANTVTTNAQPNITSVGTLTSLGVSGTVTASAFTANTGVFTGNGSALTSINASNISSGTINSARVPTLNQNTTGYAATVSTNAQPNITSVGTLTSLTSSGNITGLNFIGSLADGNSNITITTDANITAYVAGNANARFTITDTGANINGTLSASGNANTGNLGTSQVLATANITAPQLISNVATGTSPLTVTSTTRVANLNVSYANVSDYEVVTAQNTGTYYPTFVSASTTGNRALAANASFSANLANGGLIATTFVGNLNGNITTTEITTGANTTQGNITGDWILTAGSKMQATYADLAEYYEADQEYEPGTVLEFGGDKEVTIAQDGTTRIAGVISTNPAYVMNASCPGIATPIALQGRVPVKVRGKVKKGDMMVSGGNGYARPWNNPQMGMVIGKSLENFEGLEGVIEIAVGRL